MSDLLLHNARLLDPASGMDAKGFVALEGGLIKQIGKGAPDPKSGKAKKSVNCRGACLAPGLVDMRVKTADPGAEHLEALATLLGAAAAGGITSIGVLPDTKPVIDDASMIDSLSLRARRIGGTRLHIYGAATLCMEGAAMAELGLMAEAGAVGFANGTRTVMDSLVMRRLLSYSGMLGLPFIQHCEDHDLTRHGEMNEGETSTRLGLVGQPAVAEAIIIDRDMHLVRLTGARYHAAHISTRAAVDSIRRAKAEGLAVTADTAPPYFMLNEIAAAGYDSACRLLPPLRAEDDRQAVIEGIADGTIDAIASDHIPVDGDAKAQPFGHAQPGASGIDTLLAISLLLVHQKRIPMLRAIEALSLAPATILGLDSRGLAKGGPGDLVLFEPDAGWVVRAADFVSASRVTPFEGLPVQGRVRMTLVDGEPVFERE